MSIISHKGELKQANWILGQKGLTMPPSSLGPAYRERWVSEQPPTHRVLGGPCCLTPQVGPQGPEYSTVLPYECGMWSLFHPTHRDQQVQTPTISPAGRDTPLPTAWNQQEAQAQWKLPLQTSEVLLCAPIITGRMWSRPRRLLELISLIAFLD